MKRAIILTSVIFLLAITSQAFAMTSITSLSRFSDMTESMAEGASNTDSALGVSGNYVFRCGNNNGESSTNGTETFTFGMDLPYSDKGGDDGSEIVPPNTIPEPASIILIGFGLLGAGLYRRKK